MLNQSRHFLCQTYDGYSAGNGWRGQSMRERMSLVGVGKRPISNLTSSKRSGNHIGTTTAIIATFTSSDAKIFQPSLRGG